MEFLKKHYEKILLSVVLLGLGVAAGYLPILVKEAEAESKIEATAQRSHSNTNSLPPIDFSKENKALQYMTNPLLLNLSDEHRLVNPFTWKVKADGTYIKVQKEGAEALQIKNNRPQYTVISYDRSGGAANGYFLTTQQQSGKRSPEFLKLNEKSKSGLFTLRQVEGPSEEPTAVIIELTDGEKVTLTKAAPLQRVDSYVTDLFYPPDNKDFKDKKVNDQLPFAGDVYKIVYITNNEVRVQSNQTRKQTTITWPGTH